jgi:hypothetical protein
VLTVPTLLGLDPLLAAKWLGVFATLAAAGVLASWPAERPGGSRAAGAVGAGLWLAVPRTALHAVSGMETGLAALCIVAFFRLAADRERVVQRAWPLGLCALLAGLTRPELHVLAAATFLALGARLDRPGRQALLVAALACWVMPMLMLESLRIEYYREQLPLPFYIKSLRAAHLPGLPHVFEWWGSLARHAGVLVVPALMPLALSLRVPWLATLAAMAALTPFQPIMAPELRYLWPLAPIAFLTAGSGFERLWEWCGRVPRAAWARAVVAAVPIALMLHLVRLGPITLSDDMAYARSLEHTTLRLGAEMARLAPHGLRLATSDAGAMPYLTDAWTLDLAGLNSPGVARHGERTPHDVFDRAHVSALVLVSAESQRFRAEPWSEYEAPLAAEAVARGWRRVAVRRFNDSYWLWVMAPPQSSLVALAPGP